MEIVIFAFGVALGAICYYLKSYKSVLDKADETNDITRLKIENEKLQSQIDEAKAEIAAIISAPISEPVPQVVQTLNIAYPGTKRKFDFAVIPGYKYAFLPREIQEASKRYRNLSL